VAAYKPESRSLRCWVSCLVDLIGFWLFIAGHRHFFVSIIQFRMLVIDTITARRQVDAPCVQRVFSGASLSAVAGVLLLGETAGNTSLENLEVIDFNNRSCSFTVVLLGDVFCIFRLAL
jgi:choline-glycine betaine transporter